MNNLKKTAEEARNAALQMAALSAEQKNKALNEIARSLAEKKGLIHKANQADLQQAENDKIRPALVKRLKFDELKIADTIAEIESLVKLPDPVGVTRHALELDEGLELFQVSCPIGVLGIIFESRPDALVQISSLALKSGNTVLLKGGSEAANSNRVLAEIISTASRQAGIPEGWLNLLETREQVQAILALHNLIDLIIPRGSNEFVRYIMENTKIPVLGHADGICHTFVDEEADLKQAASIAFDAKCQYPAVCNAMETLLVAESVAEEFLPRMKKQFDEAGVELRGDPAVQKIIACLPAREADWRTEYNDLILSIKIVPDMQAAIRHINYYGSHHTDAIITRNRKKAERFMDLVDSANVFWNCSTRFSDGYRYGLGAEVGISTGKIHARGPVGMEGLLTYKWKLKGQGNIVADYSGPKARPFTHQPLSPGNNQEPLS